MAMNDQLKRRIAMLEVEQERQQDEVNQLNSIITEPKKEKTTQKQKSVGYVISLDFGGGAPISEWSDETHGWRTLGLGTRYPTQELANRKLVQLKKSWPEYPFKIDFS